MGAGLITFIVVVVVGVVVGVFNNALGAMDGCSAAATKATSQLTFSFSEIHFLMAMTCPFKPAASGLLSCFQPLKHLHFGLLCSFRGFFAEEFRTFAQPLHMKWNGKFLMSKQVTQLRGDERVRLAGTGVTPSWSVGSEMSS